MIFALIFVFLLAAVLWRKVYFNRLSLACYNNDSCDPVLVSLKPKEFSKFFGSKKVSSVRVSDSYLIFYDASDSRPFAYCGSLVLPVNFLIVSFKRGRLRSVDLSDRELESVFKKITLVL